MKTITHNGKTYEPVIEGENVILQGLHEDLLFENGYKLLKEDLEEDYKREYREELRRYSEGQRDALIEESVKESIKDDLDTHCQWLLLNCTYEVVNHNLN